MPATSKGGRKRPSSRRSSTVNSDRETTSISSSATFTAAQYRFNTLRNARIFVRHEAPIKEVQCRIDHVVRRETSEERKCHLSRIAETLCNEFITILSRPGREDDCIEPIQCALSSMDSDQKFDFLRKAGMALPSNITNYLMLMS